MKRLPHVIALVRDFRYLGLCRRRVPPAMCEAYCCGAVPTGSYPVAGIAVTVYAQQIQSGPSGVGEASDGMYYLYNIPGEEPTTWRFWVHGYLLFPIVLSDSLSMTGNSSPTLRSVTVP